MSQEVPPPYAPVDPALTTTNIAISNTRNHTPAANGHIANLRGGDLAQPPHTYRDRASPNTLDRIELDRYFAHRPYRGLSLQTVQRITVARAISNTTRADDVPFPNEYPAIQARDVNLIDWAKFTQAIDANLRTNGQLSSSMTVMEFVVRQAAVDSVIEKWNRGFFVPRGVHIVPVYSYIGRTSSPVPTYRSTETARGVDVVTRDDVSEVLTASEFATSTRCSREGSPDTILGPDSNRTSVDHKNSDTFRKPRRPSRVSMGSFSSSSSSSSSVSTVSKVSISNSDLDSPGAVDAVMGKALRTLTLAQAYRRDPTTQEDLHAALRAGSMDLHKKYVTYGSSKSKEDKSLALEQLRESKQFFLGQLKDLNSEITAHCRDEKGGWMEKKGGWIEKKKTLRDIGRVTKQAWKDAKRMQKTVDRHVKEEMNAAKKQEKETRKLVKRNTICSVDPRVTAGHVSGPLRVGRTDDTMGGRH